MINNKVCRTMNGKYYGVENNDVAAYNEREKIKCKGSLEN